MPTDTSPHRRWARARVAHWPERPARPARRAPAQPLGRAQARARGRARDPQLGLGLGPVGPVAQGQHQLPAGADEQAPADGGALDDQADHEQEPGRDPGLRPEHHVDEPGHQAQDEDGRRGPRGPVDRDREHPHDHGPGHRLREGGEPHQHHGEPDRPAPAQPQPGAADRPGDHVGGEQPARRWRGRLQPPADHQQREDRRGQEQQRVHDPVTRAPPDPGPAPPVWPSPKRSSSERTGPEGRARPWRPGTIPKSRRPLLPSAAAPSRPRPGSGSRSDGLSHHAPRSHRPELGG